MAESIELTVTGMKCGGCETNVKGKVGAIDGVLSVAASSKEKKVEVDYDAAKTNLDAIKAAIAEAGFTVE
ncbi:heavy-metal-associated domain-containing protein [Methylomicrobium sp. Wu6]|uniref:heavy-metal-associated domain-containing protein n=1 Tax=Methylomicrobium sp. Wu6 TaxID=3107928 RepID=UPI002DD69B0D|nr:heavy-metal-associated domain-containing protein [Methylomicrobium sp. Wu6]MEC4749206.1 heavy-metal-associated domain-containing protein [Methylomicrobium sp. Wu6]